MLTGITLENFKAFKDPQFIPFKPITLVFGQNSAGKSSIIHALAFLKHVHATNGHCDPATVEFGWDMIYLGSWQNLVYGHDASATMRITLHWNTMALTWEFENGPDGPRVASFVLSENKKPIAMGGNLKTKQEILWSISLHSSHPFWSEMKGRIWSIASGEGQAHRDAYEAIEESNSTVEVDETLLEITRNPSIQNFKDNFSDVFDAYYTEWLGDTWRELPRKSYDDDDSLKTLFPGIAKNLEGNLPPQWMATLPVYEHEVLF